MRKASVDSWVAKGELMAGVALLIIGGVLVNQNLPESGEWSSDASLALFGVGLSVVVAGLQIAFTVLGRLAGGLLGERLWAKSARRSGPSQPRVPSSTFDEGTTRHAPQEDY